MSSIPPSCSAILENFQATGPERHSCWGPGTKLPSLRAAMENAEVSPIFLGIESRGNIGFNMMRHGFHQQNEDVAWKTLRFSPDHWWNNEEVTHLPGTYQHVESRQFTISYNAEFTLNAPWRLGLKCFGSGKTSWEISHSPSLTQRIP